MREFKILYRKDGIIYLLYVLVGIFTPAIMTLLSLAVGSEDYSASFDGVFNTTLLMNAIGSILYLEHENRQLEVGCFVVNRKRYIKFRIVQIIARGIVLTVALMAAAYLWRWLMPGGEQALDTSYEGSTVEGCIACGIILILMNSISLLDSVRKKPLFTAIGNNEKRNNFMATTCRSTVSVGKRFLAIFVYMIVIVLGNIIFEIIVHEEKSADRMVVYGVTSAICVVLWGISICFMRKKELRQQ